MRPFALTAIPCRSLPDPCLSFTIILDSAWRSSGVPCPGTGTGTTWSTSPASRPSTIPSWASSSTRRRTSTSGASKSPGYLTPSGSLQYSKYSGFKQRLAIVSNFVQARCACLPLLRHPLCEHGSAQRAQVHGQVRRLLCVRPTSFLHFVVCGLKAGGGNTAQLQLQAALRGPRRYWMDI